jgi:hypothetical protein
MVAQASTQPRNYFDPTLQGKMWKVVNDPAKYVYDSIGVSYVDYDGFSHYYELSQLWISDVVQMTAPDVNGVQKTWRDRITGDVEWYTDHFVMDYRPVVLNNPSIDGIAHIAFSMTSHRTVPYFYVSNRTYAKWNSGECGTNGSDVTQPGTPTGTELWFTDYNAYGHPTTAWLQHARAGDYIVFGPTRWQITGDFTHAKPAPSVFSTYRIPATCIQGKPSALLAGSFYTVDPVIIPKMW